MAMSAVLKTVKQAIWLGWKVETNWADPLVFAIYYLVRPIAGLLIVGFIYLVGSFATGTVNPGYFAYIFVGNSFFLYVVQVTMTMSMLIHEDRSHYEVLKHIYLSPGSLWWYIIGRALNGVMNASISLILTLGFGWLIFQGLLGVPIQINWFGIDFLILALSLIIGIVCFIAIGFIVSGINIMTAKVEFVLTEYVTGILYLFGGVVFQPELLPAWGQAITNALPVTYFLRLVRFSILQQGAGTVGMDLAYLALTTAATVVIGFGVFRIALYKARRDGLIDRKQEY